MPIEPESDPNEAYEIGHTTPQEHGMPPDWWTAFVMVSWHINLCRLVAVLPSVAPAIRLTV